MGGHRMASWLVLAVVAPLALAGCAEGDGDPAAPQAPAAPAEGAVPAPPVADPAVGPVAFELRAPERIRFTGGAVRTYEVHAAQPFDVTGVWWAPNATASPSPSPAAMVLWPAGLALPPSCGPLPPDVRVWSSRIDATADWRGLPAGVYRLRLAVPSGEPLDVRFGDAADGADPDRVVAAADAAATFEAVAYVEAQTGPPATASFEERLQAPAAGVFVARFDPGADAYPVGSRSRSAVRIDEATCSQSAWTAQPTSLWGGASDLRVLLPSGPFTWLGASEVTAAVSSRPRAEGTFVAIG